VTNAIDAEWQRVLAGPLNNNLLMNTAKGKTAFACGVGFMLSKMQESKDPIMRLNAALLYDELKEFVDAYMAIGSAS
jgi:hypothetical protein